jgi:16S rRNA A1518/A1519 N6-dimethyltransferase RsmA/KsgA/DIM1 with predicted DNA glycosylase/AP lyase activity
MPHDTEQHMLANLEPHRTWLAGIDLAGRGVVEFGVGTGALTRLILERNPARIIGYEIDPDLCTVTDSRLELRIGDLRTMDYAYLADPSWCVIANPPYDCLEFLARNVLDCYGVADVLLMVSPKRLDLFPGYVEAFRLTGDAFTPPSTGEHPVLQRGFLASP